MRRIEQRKSAGLQDACLRDYRFENSCYESEGLTKARLYVENILNPMGDDSAGLVFFGPVGTGKTFAAGCIANALIDHNIPVLMTSIPKLLSLSWDSEGKWPEIVQGLNDYRLLILDDFGVERETPYVLEKVYYVIDERYKSKKPFILTTNLTLHEMRNPKDQMHQRIYDRIWQRCGFVLFNENNYRLEKAAEVHKELRERLNGGTECSSKDTVQSHEKAAACNAEPELKKYEEDDGQSAEGRQV